MTPTRAPSAAPKFEKPATIYDVAARAGVSHQTVSRYLKGFEGIRPETRERVRVALEELEYRPNMSARALATNRSNRIAVLTSDLVSAGPTQTVQGLATAARGAGYLVDIIAVDLQRRGAIDDAVGLLRQQDLAGIVVIAVSDPVRDGIRGVDFGVPVYIDSGPADLDAADGHSYNALGVELAVAHLIGLGHRKIVHLAGPEEWIAARNRASAFDEAIATAGLTRFRHLVGDWSAASGHDAVAATDLPEEVTAIVSANDQMALGAVNALAGRGIRVPQDVSVTGFDDIAESRYFLPPLTTVRIDFEQQGIYLFDSLIARIDNADPPDARAFMAPTLIVRSSTASPARV